MKAQAATAKPKVRILVVDDERSITTTLRLILESQGFEVATASGGNEAIAVARTFSPDCVLSDVMMPDLNGISASVEIARFLPKCRIVLFSGQASALDLLTEARSHGHDFPLLQKPIHPAELIEQIKRAVGERR